MSSKSLHLVATNEDGFGWSLTSPQVPGLTYGRRDLDQFQNGMRDVLDFADAPDLPWALHQEIRGVSPEGVEYRIRAAQDNYAPERRVVGDRVRSVVLTDPDLRPSLLASTKHSGVGDVLFITVVPDDRLGWVFDQLDARDGRASVVGSEDDQLIWTTTVSNGEHGDDMASLAEIGLSLDSTVGDMRLAIEMLPVIEARVLVPA